jgi:hypothetical protein
MPGRGPAPKRERSRPNDTARREAEFKKVAADGLTRGPELPEVPGFVWHPRTLAWWDTWRRSPMAATFIESDWSFLLDTAALHSQMWDGDTKLAAEVRQRVGKLAGTPEDRLRLRLEVDEDSAKASRRVRNMDRQRRERLLSIVEG